MSQEHSLSTDNSSNIEGNIIYKNIIYIKIENEQNTSSNNNENSIAGYINILNIT